MRLLHPKILEIAANRTDLPKTIISHAWSEVFKWLASGRPKHPKMFIYDDYDLGVYLNIVAYYGQLKGCKLDHSKINNLPIRVGVGFRRTPVEKYPAVIGNYSQDLFDDNYLFSDLVSLYYKGDNLFPDVFGEDWKKYCPVISHKEIKRQVDKTLANSSRLRK